MGLAWQRSVAHAQRVLVLGLALLVACGFDPEATSGDEERPDGGSAPGTDAAPGGDGEDCAAPGPGCTCAAEPGEQSCVHSHGGVYGDGACSASWQCCAGSWMNCTNCCGPCTCSEATGETGCTGDGEGGPACFPSFEGTAAPIPEEVREQMRGRSWHAELDCPDLDSLVLLRMTHWDFDGAIREGQMVVAQAVAGDVLEAFRRIYDARFPIERMVLIHEYDGDDDASMAANNTSAFNCRRVTGGTSLSHHSYGSAIDINPVQNPYVTSTTVLPPAGAAYLDRGNVRQGMIVRPGPVTSAFDAIGWGWGGDWTTTKDYQHFSLSGK